MRKMIMDVFPAALRGRYAENGKVVQRLEIRPDEITNTITTVEKDNIVVFIIGKEESTDD